MTELRDVYALLRSELMQRYNHSTQEALWNVHQNPSTQQGSGGDVCPEVWMGNRDGYPFYFIGTGHVLGNCTSARTFESLITVVLNTRQLKQAAFDRILTGLQKVHPGMTLIYGGGTANSSLTSEHAKPFAEFIHLNKSLTDGSIWSMLIQNVTTKYSLIANDIIDFGADSALHRLIRMIDYLGIDVATGSHRNRSGHWKLDCYQTKMQNYGYRLVEGYDLSYNSCIYCDYASPPFAAKTSLLKEVTFNADLQGEFVFIDFFEKLKQTKKVVLSCPDVEFFTESLSRVSEYSSTDWVPFMKQWDLNLIHPPGRPPLDMPCKQLPNECRMTGGTTIHSCCLQGLTNMLKFIFVQCHKNNIGCEIDSGTMVGAVKLYNTLPWERDADLSYRTSNHSVFKGLVGTFEEAGYRLTNERVPKSCPKLSDKKNVNCGYWGVGNRHWRIELWGATILGHDRAQLDYFRIGKTTQILIDGQWFPCYPNPATFSRSKYGDNIFEHVEHWGTLGHSTAWVAYNTGAFLKCPTPGHHSCLDQYLPDGNLQFSEIWV